MPVTNSLAEHQALARRHVDSGRNIVERQIQLIARIRRLGGDPSTAESLLLSFERSLAIFEDDLARLMKKPPLIG